MLKEKLQEKFLIILLQKLLKDKEKYYKKIKFRGANFILIIDTEYAYDKKIADIYAQFKDAAKKDLYVQLKRKYPSREAQKLILEYLEIEG